MGICRITEAWTDKSMKKNITWNNPAIYILLPNRAIQNNTSEMKSGQRRPCLPPFFFPPPLEPPWLEDPPSAPPLP